MAFEMPSRMSFKIAFEMSLEISFKMLWEMWFEMSLKRLFKSLYGLFGCHFVWNVTWMSFEMLHEFSRILLEMSNAIINVIWHLKSHKMSFLISESAITKMTSRTDDRQVIITQMSQRADVLKVKLHSLNQRCLTSQISLLFLFYQKILSCFGFIIYTQSRPSDLNCEFLLPLGMK